MEIAGAVSGIAVHFVTGILAVHFLVTLAGVTDASSASALELIGRAQGGITENLIRIVSTVVLSVTPDAVLNTAAIRAAPVALLTDTVGTI